VKRKDFDTSEIHIHLRPSLIFYINSWKLTFALESVRVLYYSLERFYYVQNVKSDLFKARSCNLSSVKGQQVYEKLHVTTTNQHAKSLLNFNFKGC
jgi:hypothetical protein